MKKSIPKIELKLEIDVNGTITYDSYIVGKMADKTDFNWLKEYDEKSKINAPKSVSIDEMQKIKSELVDVLMENARLKDIYNNPEFKEAVAKVGELLVERDELQGGILAMARLLGRRV